MLTRRHFLSAAGLAGLSASLGFPALGHAEILGERRLVLVLLRGAMDGLAAVPPVADPVYAGLRGSLALAETEVHRLDGFFGLHPALNELADRYRTGELALVQAVASPYRERSHFDGQNLLENGTAKPYGASDGWLNRALATLSPGPEAIALCANLPLVLRGPARTTSWAPSRLPDADPDTLSRLASLYARDPVLGPRFAEGMQAQELAASDMGGAATGGRGGLGPAKVWPELAHAAAKFLAAPDGPRVAVLDTVGWDTHANQGAAKGLLAGRFSALDQSLANLRVGLGDVWARTVVMVVSEFGRTAAVNGTGGTDHGTASAMFLIGGAVNGGRVIGDWPGLSARDLYQGRDLRATTDLRSVFKGVLAAHLGVTDSALAERVFPDSAAARALSGLLRN